jgi:hypothetical protein
MMMHAYSSTDVIQKEHKHLLSNEAKLSGSLACMECSGTEAYMQAKKAACDTGHWQSAGATAFQAAVTAL